MTLRYLSEDDVILINERVTKISDQLRDRLLLRSAIGRQWAGFGNTELYPALHEKVAALFHGLCSNHAFVDGNKRTAVVAAEALCLLNDATMNVDEDELVGLAVETAESLSVDDVIKRFASIVAPE